MQALNNQTVSATKLVFDSTERWILGPQLTLDHCHIVLKGSTWRTLQLRDVRLVDCTIEASTELKDFTDWCKCQLVRCRFLGTFVGNSFGEWIDEHGSGGGLVDCDFFESRLVDCQFIGVDVVSLRMPPWPFCTLMDPVGREEELMSATWPGKLGFWVEAVVMCPEEATAVTFDAKQVAEGFDCELDVLHEYLQQLGGVLM